MDVVTAFLYDDLEDVIFIEVPDGFKNPNNPNIVCKLQNSLRCLKQALRQ